MRRTTKGKSNCKAGGGRRRAVGSYLIASILVGLLINVGARIDLKENKIREMGGSGGEEGKRSLD